MKKINNATIERPERNAKIAVAQIEVTNNIKQNLKKILQFIDKTASNNIDIICFPESCLGDDFLSIDCVEIKLIREKCMEHSIYCIIGCHLEENKVIYNSIILINRKGNIEYIYRKQNLFPGLDLEKTTPGKYNDVIQTDFGKIGLIICWDFAFANHIKQLSKNGAEIIFCPSYLMNEAKISKEVFRSLPLTRAFENLSYFVTCDAYTKEVFAESYICSPMKILNKIQQREGLVIQDLDLNLISDLRNCFDCLKD